ncbi:YybH family protein [Parachitinimonas caeni]|uniref:Nuclear transport factor 2 family protein n=1 Tax=Parachitinimonas caeni TaxID=3031301 RepID=A0ABT7DS65_9NEIS|nr:nuclear transport factor 2 family protein [Parachitinimonas caeni]MDK2122910.1 nuclear transport factor 2 family protein [Parachitinimonas caeni]
MKWISARRAACLLPLLSLPVAATDLQELEKQVMEAERAFAKTMADRDLEGFKRFVAEDAVFSSGKSLRGKQQVVEAWKAFYAKPTPPFSWKPESVEVLESGKLALSRGPVYDPKGKQVARFHSIWRLEAPNTWRVVFDFGVDVCDCKAAEEAGKPS